MINQEFLSNCSDEQINKGVAWLEASKYGFKQPCEIMIYDGFAFTDISKFAFSPCTNPNDIMSIAFANDIGVIPANFEGNWKALSVVDEQQYEEDTYKFDSWNTNPLRAICEVYILMSVEL